ncbi:MAG: formylglycine-generating enzyme family protein, partial [Thermoguttaceae bacterium]|nr:formylglycine-generating enzyme family protein [Thermoguttaceae bacterium]MBR0190649.1 formylglycine-generating enzyme family protein [Thermoguttaceae bacterium]
MTPIEEILKISQNLEQILQNQYGATGRGLREKVDSVADQLPEETVRKIGKLASMRNKATHENIELANERIAAFKRITGEVLVSMMLYKPLEGVQTVATSREMVHFQPNKSESMKVPKGQQPGERKVLTVDGIEYAFRWCPPGEFMMGDEFDEYDCCPIHEVKLTRGFWLLETQVTQAMWQSVMGKNPSYFNGEQNPVENVNWKDCQKYCQQLSAILSQRIQLPTEAQWEYACRAGTTGNYAGDLDSMAWCCEDEGIGSTHPVAQKKPNAWGLYDMHGNVWEWCSDYYDNYYYDRSPVNDPENATPSSIRVARGGSWSADATACQSAYRESFFPGNRYEGLGFRVVLVPCQDE